jgi:hypothetical protein
MTDYKSVKFFLEALEKHSKVQQCWHVPDDEESILRIERTDGMSTVTVYLADAYDFSVGEYMCRSRRIGRGDFILVSGFRPDVDSATIEFARKDGIGVGNLRRLMGALNWSNVWEYLSPEERGVKH